MEQTKNAGQTKIEAKELQQNYLQCISLNQPKAKKIVLSTF